MTVYTIGFTHKTAERFFSLLKDAGVRRLLDVRLNNSSQLAGYSKRDDLRFFTERLLDAEYRHVPELAPTQLLLDKYKKHKGAWEEYERTFLALMVERRIEQLPRDLFDGACLLCSEDTPVNCHRRLVAEYLRDRWGDMNIVHL